MGVNEIFYITLFGMENNFKHYRLEKGINATEMAKRLSVSRNTLHNYENGSYEPSFETLIKISQILEVSIDDLLNNKRFETSNMVSKESLISDIEELLEKYK